jgi:hypothetical protein
MGTVSRLSLPLSVIEAQEIYLHLGCGGWGNLQTASGAEGGTVIPYLDFLVKHNASFRTCQLASNIRHLVCSIYAKKLYKWGGWVSLE